MVVAVLEGCHWPDILMTIAAYRYRSGDLDGVGRGLEYAEKYRMIRGSKSEWLDGVGDSELGFERSRGLMLRQRGNDI